MPRMTANTTLRALASAALLAVSTPAVAGGIGILTMTGLHTQPVYFYDAGNNMAQIKQTQTILSVGSGIDLVLGDQDDRVTGTFRAYWMMDGPEKDPATLTTTVDPANVVAAYRTDPAHIGVAEVGVQFGLLGRPDAAQLVTTINVGSGFLTTDHREFLLAQVGVGGTWTFAPTLQAYGTINYGVRQRKGLRHGGNAYLGVRYLFD